MLTGIRRSQLIAYKHRKDSMRKLLILAASLVALSALIATPFASAATTDTNGVVTVSKGDIQSAMGWNNAKWDAAINAPNGVANVGNLITTSHGTTPVFNNGGWLTLNGQIVANYPNDEYHEMWVTDPEIWCPINTMASSSWTGGVNTAVTPIRNAQQKVTGYKVSAAPATDGYVYWTSHVTFDCTECPAVVGAEHHLALARQRRWQRRLGREGQRQGRHGHPVRGPHRLIQLRTKATNLHHNSASRFTQPGALVVSIRNRQARTTSPDRRSL